MAGGGQLTGVGDYRKGGPVVLYGRSMCVADGASREKRHVPVFFLLIYWAVRSII